MNDVRFGITHPWGYEDSVGSRVVSIDHLCDYWTSVNVTVHQLSYGIPR